MGDAEYLIAGAGWGVLPGDAHETVTSVDGSWPHVR